MSAIGRNRHIGNRVLPVVIFVAFFLLVAAYITGPAILEWFLVVKSPTIKADALVVMAGSRYQRLPAVVELYQQGVASKIYLTNDGVRGAWSKKHQKNLYLIEWAREYLLDQGMPDEAIELLNFTESGSYYDALNTRDYVLANGAVRSLLVVTSDYHTRRTLWTFNKVFAGADVKIAVFPIPKDPDYKGRRLRVMTTELVKLVYYLVRYGLFPVG
jgi:uncharacterized SAM-binding protein YcdF (DUF218 family)